MQYTWLPKKKATELLITDPIPNQDQNVSITPPPPTSHFHCTIIKCHFYLLHDTKRKHKIFFLTHTPWAYSIKYFRFPSKHILSPHLLLFNIKTPALPTIWLWELLVIFQLYFKVIFTQTDMFCLNIALKYT